MVKKIIQYVSTSLILTGLILGISCIPTTRSVQAQTGNSTALYQVRLDMKLVSQSTRIKGESIVPANSKNPYTIVESTFVAKAKAFGGDVLLPMYRDDIVFEPKIKVPYQGTNAVIPGVPSITYDRTLPQTKDGQSMLKEYEEVTMYIKVQMKVLTATMPNRLEFRNKLNSVIWNPIVPEGKMVDMSLSTTDEVYNSPIRQNTIPIQVTTLNWQSDSVLLLKETPVVSVIKKDVKEHGGANVFSILKQFFK